MKTICRTLAAVAVVLFSATALADDANLNTVNDQLAKAEKALADGRADNAKIYVANAKQYVPYAKPSRELEAAKTKIPDLEKRIEASMGLSRGCVNTTEFELGMIEREYGVFKKDGKTRVRAWDMRNELERARWTLYQPPANKGQALPNICDETDHKRPQFAALEARFRKAETMVVEVETAKAIKWVGFTPHSGMTWNDANGKEIPNSEEVF